MNPTYRLNGRGETISNSCNREDIPKGKGKLSHLNGTGSSPDNPKFHAWDEEESNIISWPWNSMQSEINKNCMFLASAKEIEKLSTSLTRNAALIYEIKARISTTK